MEEPKNQQKLLYLKDLVKLGEGYIVDDITSADYVLVSHEEIDQDFLGAIPLSWGDYLDLVMGILKKEHEDMGKPEKRGKQEKKGKVIATSEKSGKPEKLAEMEKPEEKNQKWKQNYLEK